MVPDGDQLLHSELTARYLFELRLASNPQIGAAWPLGRASALVVAVREAARSRLSSAMPALGAEIERVLVGRKPNDSDAAPQAKRVRIIAVPYIGAQHSDCGIRHILVEVPAACPLRRSDIRGAFSDAAIATTHSTEPHDILLVRSNDEGILQHYSLGSSASIFRSVTPLALPIYKGHKTDGGTNRPSPVEPPGFESNPGLSAARAAVTQSLRHAGVGARARHVYLQRKPFDSMGARAEQFADETRFKEETLWHAEISFDVPVQGPLLLGDGRFLGLGLMAPADNIVSGIHAFTITAGLSGSPDPVILVRALRRATMARVQTAIGFSNTLDPFFSGHEEDGDPVRREHSSHLTFAFEPASQILLILAPHLVERRPSTAHERELLQTLSIALSGLAKLRAGPAGILSLNTASLSENTNPPIGRSRVWSTVTPYVVRRHARAADAAQAVKVDVMGECTQLGIPAQQVIVRNIRGRSGVGLSADLTITFNHIVHGPLLLGRTRYSGGGMLLPEP